MKQALRRQLKSLWLGELVATIVFVFAYFSIRASLPHLRLGGLSLLALVTLCLILLQGSAYWWLKLRQLDPPHRPIDPRLLQVAFLGSLLLLLTYPAALLLAVFNGTIEDSLPDALVGAGLYVFALGEFVHYFLVKITRSDTDRQALKRRRQVTARLMRELQRSETRKANP